MIPLTAAPCRFLWVLKGQLNPDVSCSWQCLCIICFVSEVSCSFTLRRSSPRSATPGASTSNFAT